MSAGKMTPGPLLQDGHAVKRNDGSTYAVADTVEIARAIACLPELIEAARLAADDLDYHSETRVRLRRILARIEGEEA